MLRRIDPLGPLFALVGLVVFVSHGFSGVLTRDLSLYAYSGQQFADGVPPYVSVMNRAGPLAHVVPGIGAIIAGWIGKDDVLMERLVMLGLTVLTVWLMYLTARDLWRSRIAGSIAAATLLTIQGVMLYATGGPREKTTMVLMVLLAIYAITHRRWGWAGAAISLATLTWQPAFFLGMIMALAALPYADRRAFLRSLGWICLGGAIPALLTVVGFALAGALDDLVNGFVLINLHYTDQTGLLTYLRDKPTSIFHGFGQSLWVLLAGLVLAVVNAVVLLVRAEDRGDRLVRAQIAIGVGVVGSLLWSLRAFNGWADAMFVVPVAVLGFTAGVFWLVGRVPFRVPVVAAYCVLAVALGTANAVAQNVPALQVQRMVTHRLMTLGGPDATVVSIGGPMPLVLTHQRNPVRYQMFLDGFDRYVDDTYPGGLRALALRLEASHPTFVSMDYPWRYRSWGAPLLDNYVKLGITADVYWFARKDLGHRTLERMRRVIAEHRVPTRQGGTL